MMKYTENSQGNELKVKKLKRSEMNAFIETDERLHAAKDNWTYCVQET